MKSPPSSSRTSRFAAFAAALCAPIALSAAVASNFGATGSWVYRIGVKVVKPFLKTPEQGARTSVYLASSPEVEGVTGEYFANCRIASTSARAKSDADAKRLWALSEQLCGVTW